METTYEKRFDVIIYNIESGEVVSLPGTNMHFSTGFYNAEKREDAAWDRINTDYYNTAIVPTGSLSVGDIYNL